MTRRLAPLLALLMIATSSTVSAAVEAVAINGKRVLLNDDHTWEYIENNASDVRFARLSVETVQGGKNHCRIGMRLKNDLADEIISIIFMFSAYVDEEVRYETVTKGFQHLKPTNDLYNEFTIEGLACDELAYLRVHGADRCEVGELNKFSAAKGQCLKLVEVQPSDKITIFKRYEDQAPEPEPVATTETTAEEETLEEKWARELKEKEAPADDEDMF